MLVLPTSLVAIASSTAVSDPGEAWKIAMACATTDFAASTDSLATNIPSTTTLETFTTMLQPIPSSSSSLILSFLGIGAQQEVLGNNIHTLEDAWAVLSATFSRVSDILASAKASDFESIVDNPLVFLSTIAFVTASDMVPFVPCQPLAISLGARYGPWAFPVCVVGQTLAGILAFQSSRKVADTEQVQKVLESLGDEGKVRFQKFKTENLLGKNRGDNGNRDGTGSEEPRETLDDDEERTVFLALVGLRLAPFFPFSAGNYLLGGATDVGLRPFVLATILGCLLSNAVSVLVGMGGAELYMNAATN